MRVPTFDWTCGHCGRRYLTDGKRTGFVKAGFFRHEHCCSLRTPAERRATNRRDEAKWKRLGRASSIVNDPDHPGLKDDPFAMGFDLVNAPDKPGQMVAIVVPDYVPVPRLKRLDFKWFWDLKNPLFESAKNTVEMRTRITWLSEGSLRYHLDPSTPHPPHGGCPDEKALYAKFLLARGHYPRTT